MAFRPGGPGFSGNSVAGGAPPMMMFNPAQFSQPQAPQIPQPSPNPANQAQQANQSMSNNSVHQQVAAPSQDSGTCGSNSHQQCVPCRQSGTPRNSHNFGRFRI